MAGGAGGGGGPGGRRRSRRDSLDASPPGVGPSSSRTPPGSKDRRTSSRRLAGKPIKERWLLTRKTWRYMADAGRRLIPDSISSNATARPEDSIPKIEKYFQEVCSKEPRFLLWRKASYPGSLAGFRTARRRRGGKIGGSCRAAKTCSADEADDSRGSVSSGSAASGFGQQDRARIRREWLGLSGSSKPSDEEDAKVLADMLDRYLSMQAPDPGGGGSTGTACSASATNSKQTTAASSTRSISVSDRSASTCVGAAGGGGGFAKEPNIKSTSFTNSPSTSSLDYQKLIEKLEQHLNQIMAEGRRDEATRMIPSGRNIRVDVTSSTSGSVGAMSRTNLPYQSDLVHKQLLDTLGRYYSKSPNREHVISDILTDRKLLEKLYFDLRCTRGFRGPRATGAYAQPTARYWTKPSSTSSGIDRTRKTLGSPPPLIAVQGPSTERGPVDSGIQTDPVPKEVLEQLLILEREKEDQSSPPPHKPGRRRSSLDNDDVSPSVSDTIKRYLRMARKKSVDSDKADRFKRVNYDRNLRNIKAKGEITKPGDDDGNNKGCQTVDKWMINYREMRTLEPGETMTGSDDPETSRNASSRSSIDAGLGSEEACTPKHHQSFLSQFLHSSSHHHHHGTSSSHKDKPHSAPGSPALTSSSSSNLPGGSVMQKSKSSSSVVSHGSRLVAKKIWKSRSKSSNRSINLVSAWTPQGKCTWAGTGGRRVTLQETPLRSLSEVERKVLCRVAVAKLQALNLGVHIRLPTESLGSSGSVTAKPKRRAYLLKRKALTTGFFDSKSKDEKDKESGGQVFGISLQQCLENDRLARIASGEIVDVGSYLTRSSRHGSRTSFTSLIETTTTTASKTDEGGSCESLSSKGGSGGGGGGALTDSGVLELSDGGPPGEWDAVPSIVKHCIMHLEATGLHTLGIFRVSPSKKRVRQLREDWDFGRETKIGADQCPHDVAALLKEYFRDLPDPLLCRDLYQAFVHTQKLRNRRLQGEALKHMIQLLPMPNRETLHALLNFLSEVAANSEDRTGEDGEVIPGNKMDVSNLATVFAPNILHCVKAGQSREVSAERAEERIDVINVVRALLENVSNLFTINADTLDELYLHMMDSHPAELDLALSRRADEQCVDEADLCSETENYSVEENTSPTSTTFPGSTISSRKLYSREECLHQSAGVGGDIGPRPRRSKRPGTRRKDDSSGRSNSVDSGSSEDPREDPRKASSPMVITASLTIPMSAAFTLNLDDPDIPYIEDAANQQNRKQQTHGYYQQTNAPPRRQRQRSVSGSEGGGGRHGSDSAVGSSATLSGDQPPSSPPSWASSPPASPDSAVTAVSYIPEQPQQPAPQQQVLQRVSFTTSSELWQITRSSSQQEAARATIAPPHTPSITSIGGAVMRSKTADIERMIQQSRSSDARQPSSRSTAAPSSPGLSALSSSLLDSKKYTKRRYTDSRHQTRHIPDAESLASSQHTSLVSRLGAALHSASSATTSTAPTGSAAQPVWKRRELISSAPKQRGTFF